MKAYLDNMKPGDRRALLVLSVFLGSVLLYWGAMQPAWQYYGSGKSAVSENLELLEWMDANASRIQSTASQPEQTGQNLLQTLTATAKEYDLTISRYQPQQQDGVRLWLNEANYVKAMEWLEELQVSFGVEIETITIDRTQKAGQVNIQCTLS